MTKNLYSTSTETANNSIASSAPCSLSVSATLNIGSNSSSSFQPPASSRLLKPALLLDRDGTLIQEVDHCHRPEDVIVMEGAAKGLAKAHEHGWYNVIITNQSGIGRGYFTEKEFQEVQEEVQRQVGGRIDATYMAPDLPNGNSLRRKPAPGMILEAASELGIDLSASFMIGDRKSDIEAGKAAGCQTILVLTGYGKEHRDCGADFVVQDVAAAIEVALTSQYKTY
ncbi:MAG: D-glycero-alpha-D-manno-heptose-1,7-bisphosphate 7-phosphatase [Chthoniobacterales bacterium]